jgi:outer membrane protein
MRTLLFPALALALLVGAPRVARPAAARGVAELERVAVVDVQRVILETREGRKAKKDLEKTFARSQGRLERKAKDLQGRVDDLRAKAAMLSQNKLMERQQELMRVQAELERLQLELQQDIVEKEALLTVKIYKKVSAIVGQIALEEKLQVVLVRSQMTVIFANPKLDLTNRVIVAYDKKHDK